MVVIKWSDAIKGPIVTVDGQQCGGLYKEDHGYIIPWSGIDPYSKMNSFNFSQMIMIGLSQGTSTMKNSITGEDL